MLSARSSLTRPGDLDTAEHRTGVPRDLLTMWFGHRECECRGGRGARWATPPPPGINEVEPNNSRTAAQLISTDNTTINGTMSSSSDTDYYRMTLAAGGTLTATLTPNASSDYDLFVYNSNGVLIGRSERGTGLVDTVTVTNTGASAFTRYVRVVYWSGGTGATNGKYTLNMNW